MVEPLRAVLAGCGGISQAWLKAAQDIPSLKIVGLVDLLEEYARKRAEQFGLSQVETGCDLAAMLDRQQPDVVFDCRVLRRWPCLR
jgi:predicted dehydrogenase